MRMLLLIMNWIALMAAGVLFRQEFRYASREPMFWIIFGSAFVLLILNIGYITTTKRTFSFRALVKRFISGWKAASTDQQSST